MNTVTIFNEAVKPDGGGSHDVEHIGGILRRMFEPAPGAAFDLTQSRALDHAIWIEEHVC